ncbi:hypothetical protein BST96_15970 [Oceanicoccus sagamiensis]|uniref:Type 4 fimbrial biogenesis protein PilX N-terminal domain-containing protein n=1 Tax=Oceanicoccus sagamiensis TaxID=716816 RepID=A0A1X9NEJ1_9GAMM|nr:hypothetical protein BST96_15970 [Oceanicoccus sagamiensis]
MLVCLVLLLAMTLIGVQSIDSSQLQSQMANNSLHKQNQYHWSLNELRAQEKALDNPLYISAVTASTLEVPVSRSISSSDSRGLVLSDSDMITRNTADAYTQSGAVVFSGDSVPPPGYSLGTYIGKDYEINIATAISDTSSKSDQTQGLTRIAPKT